MMTPASYKVRVREFLNENENGRDKELTYYCYVIDGRFIADELQYRMTRMMTSLLHGRNNAGLVRISVPVTEDFTLEQAEAYAESFLREFMPIVREHFMARRDT